MECLICFENIFEDSKYTMCKICEIRVHTECYKKWQKKSGCRKKCIMCQQKNCLMNVNKASTCLDWFKRCVYNEDYVLLDDK